MYQRGKAGYSDVQRLAHIGVWYLHSGRIGNGRAKAVTVSD